MGIKYYKIPFGYISYGWHNIFSGNMKGGNKGEGYSVSVNIKKLSLLKNNKHEVISLILDYNI